MFAIERKSTPALGTIIQVFLLEGVLAARKQP
jgi:hypothetical protein